MRQKPIWCVLVFTVHLQISIGTQGTGNPEGYRDNCNQTRVECNSRSIYRTIDGTCNNLQKPRTGAYGETFKRFYENAYDDGRYIPRFRSVLGGDLPSATNVTAEIVTSVTEPIRTRYTNLFQTFGQFVDNDILLMDTERKPNEERYVCCNESDPEIWNVDGGPCFPIQNPAEDPNGCTYFVRSLGLFDCISGERNTVNLQTAYLDGSAVYGATQADNDLLRLFEHGKLKLGPNDHLPIAVNRSDVCFPQQNDERCLLAGDIRFNFHAGVISIHTIFHRFHNQIADGLAEVNPSWNDERLFQEARRILVGVLQHITYTDYIPLLIGPAATRFSQDYTAYFRSLYHATFIEFAGAVNRFGHSIVPDQWTYGSDKLKLVELLARPGLVQADQGLEKIINGLLQDSSQKADLKFSQSLHEMFGANDSSTKDLIALNVQRGRDMGLPSYTTVRASCNLPVPFSFDDGTIQGEILGKVYRHVDDVDLYIGGLTETPVTGGIVGPTFACIIGHQFINLKYGDRFWYANKRPVPNDYYSGLRQGQVITIERLKLSRIICDNSDIKRIPENPLLHARNDNPERNCTDFEALPALNFNLWREISWIVD